MMKFNENLDKLRDERHQPLRQRLTEDLLELAERYDAEHRMVMLFLDDGVRDLNRRLAVAKTWPQLQRLNRYPFGLPEGENPPGLSKDDPRVVASGTTDTKDESRKAQ